MCSIKIKRNNKIYLKFTLDCFHRFVSVVGIELFHFFLHPLVKVVAVGIKSKEQDSAIQIIVTFLRNQ